MKALRKPSTSSHKVDTIFSLLLFSMFAILGLLLVVMGIQIYQKALDTTDLNNQARASLSYIANKVRAQDVAGQVSVEDRSGVDMIVLSEDFLGETYETRIYYYEGYLREQYVSADFDFYPEDGETLIPLQGFSVKQVQDGLIHMSATVEDGEEFAVHLAVRSEG